MAITAVAAFAEPGENYGWQIVLVCVIFTVVNIPCISTWALFGVGVREILRKPSAIKLFNRTMALLTAATTWLIVQ